MGAYAERVMKRGVNQPVYMINPELLKGAKGEIGMTMCPTYEAIKEFAAHGVNVLVTLLEKKEFAKLSVPKLREYTTEQGLESLWFPIVDEDVPTNLAEFDIHY